MPYVHLDFVLEEKEGEMVRILRLDVQKICRNAVCGAIVEKVVHLVENERKRGMS